MAKVVVVIDGVDDDYHCYCENEEEEQEQEGESKESGWRGVAKVLYSNGWLLEHGEDSGEIRESIFTICNGKSQNVFKLWTIRKSQNQKYWTYEQIS